jgi:chemotaxis protein methyltransferase WspC
MNTVEALLARVLGLDPASLGTAAVRDLIEARLRARGASDEASYLRLLETDKEELEQLLEAAVVHETWFFREPAAFDCLRDFALQRAARGARSLRILSVPCSTGEEPYSIAMTLLDAGLAPSSLSIEAVDVSEPALAAARRGVYGRNSFRGGKRPKEAHFTTRGTSFALRETVRRTVRFSGGNLLDPALFRGAEFDVVFCKNLLIYLDRAARKAALQTIDRLLAKDGILFAGHSESPEYMALGFERFGESGSFAFRRPTERPAVPTARPSARKRSSLPARPLPARTASPRPAPLRPAPRSSVEMAAVRQRVQLAAVRPSADTTPREDLAKARALADRGSVAEATLVCEAYLKCDAENAEAHCLLGLLKQASGDLTTARKSLERAVYLDPENHEALVHLALLHDQLGDRAAGAQLRRRADRCLRRKAQP